MLPYHLQPPDAQLQTLSPSAPSNPLLSPFNRPFQTQYLVTMTSSSGAAHHPHDCWPSFPRVCEAGGCPIGRQAPTGPFWGSDGSRHPWDSDSVHLGQVLEIWYFKNSPVTQIICLIWEDWHGGYVCLPYAPYFLGSCCHRPKMLPLVHSRSIRNSFSPNWAMEF